MMTVLCGGLGGARLALGLREASLDDRACFVTDVADDLTWHGALVCPDTDAVIYSLAGVFDHERGWGVEGDELPAADGSWFSVGRRDREHHVRRQLLLAGMPLSAATALLASERGIRATVVPATDDPVRTVVRHGGRWTSFQEWLVRDRAPAADAVAYDGIDGAVAAPGVCDAISESDIVVLASSSPVASIEPTLALPGVRDALRDRDGPTIAVSPIALRRPHACERDERRAVARERLLAAVGARHTPIAVAARYADCADTFVLDPADGVDADAIIALGLSVEIAPVTAGTPTARAALLARILAVSASW